MSHSVSCGQVPVAALGVQARRLNAAWGILPLAALVLVALPGPVPAADKPDLNTVLARKLLGPDETQRECQNYIDACVPRVPAVKSAAEWEKVADRLRAETLARVVFRGEA